uniref:Macrophage migration inhibitory factor n=1 Tax=Panagrolaimus sp. ES5 TaxID=591445 RepID=A0AC34FPQ3_9BILA
MPILFITTNLNKTAVPRDEAILALSKLAAKISGKPELYISVMINTNAALSFGGTLEPAALVEFSNYISVMINTNAVLSFGGTLEPAAYIEFSNVDGFSVDKSVITELTEAVCKNIGVPTNR